MLLVIDVGNTDTVFGLYDHDVPTVATAGDGLTGHWRISTHAERTGDAGSPPHRRTPSAAPSQLPPIATSSTAAP